MIVESYYIKFRRITSSEDAPIYNYDDLISVEKQIKIKSQNLVISHTNSDSDIVEMEIRSYGTHFTDKNHDNNYLDYYERMLNIAKTYLRVEKLKELNE